MSDDMTVTVEAFTRYLKSVDLRELSPEDLAALRQLYEFLTNLAAES